MDKLVLNAKTQSQITQFIKRPSHTIALVGPAGTGKGTLAVKLAAELLAIDVNKLDSYPYFKLYKPEKSSISIEIARDITNYMRLKTTGENNIRRIVIVKNAETMTVEAQNALLKTLEEPPADSVIILTLTNTRSILPTIMSRLQTISLQPVSQSTTENHFISEGHDATKVRQYYFMSGGLPGLMHALLKENEEHPLAHSIQQAKVILQADSFERLVMVDDIAKQKQAESIVQALCTISRSALYTEASRTESKEAVLKRWAMVLEKSEEAKRLLSQNAQTKLVLTSLFLHI